MNATPDALPAMVVAGCFAQGETRLVNVPQARIKKRPIQMCTELAKMGADMRTARRARHSQKQAQGLQVTGMATTGLSWRLPWQG